MPNRVRILTVPDADRAKLERRARDRGAEARVAEARQLCPGITIVESRPDVYIDYHRRLRKHLSHDLHAPDHSSELEFGVGYF